MIKKIFANLKLLGQALLMLNLSVCYATDSTSVSPPSVTAPQLPPFLLLVGIYNPLPMDPKTCGVFQYLPNPNNRTCPPGYKELFDNSLFGTNQVEEGKFGGISNTLTLNKDSAGKYFITGGACAVNTGSNTSSMISLSWRIWCIPPGY